jgi:hypothetical protein
MIFKKNYETLLQRIQTEKPNIQDIPGVLHYYKSFLQVNDEGLLRDLFVYPIHKKKLDLINQAFTNIISALEKLARYTICDAPTLHQQLRLDTNELEGIRKRNMEHLFDYARIDSIFSGRRYRVIEVNARRPQVYEDVDWLNSAIKLVLREDVYQDDISTSIVEALKARLELNSNREPELIILVSFFTNYLLRNGWKSAFFESLRIYFPNSEVLVMNEEEISELAAKSQQKDKRIIINGKSLDVLITQDIGSGPLAIYGPRGIKHKEIRDAYNAGVLELSTPPSARIIGSKLALPLIQDKEIQQKLKLNSSEIDSLDLILENFMADGSYNLGELKKDDVVIKIPHMGGGKGVYIPAGMTNEEIAELFKQHNRLVIQKKVTFGLDRIINLQNYQEEMASVTLDPFIVNNPFKSPSLQVVGYSTRAISDYKLPTHPRFNPEKNRSEIMFGQVIAHQ